jgi:hypothetical protein
MGCTGRRHMLRAFVAQGHSVNPRKEMFTGAEKNRRDSNVHLVDQAGLKVLADGADAATQPDILAIGGFSRPLQSGLDAVGDKLSYLKVASLQVAHAAAFGMTQPNANKWLHILLVVLHQTLRDLGDAPARICWLCVSGLRHSK